MKLHNIMAYVYIQYHAFLIKCSKGNKRKKQSTENWINMPFLGQYQNAWSFIADQCIHANFTLNR